MNKNINNKDYSLRKENIQLEYLKKENSKREYNLGIGLLRILLSFMVVIDHFYDSKKKKEYYYVLFYHIPSFFLISYYFTYKTFISFNIAKIKLRLERILIPYFSWCIISWIIKNIYFYVSNSNSYYSLKDFIFNLLNGHICNLPLWFQSVLILSTFSFLIIIFIFKKKYLLVLIIFAILSYILQYSGFNYNFFIKNSTIHFRLTYGRFAEAIPNAVSGFTLASLGIYQKGKKYKKKIIFFSLLILIIISKYDIFSELKSFKYGGLRLNIAAICIFLFFSLLPVEIIKCKIIIFIIKQISIYTGGVYFTHYLIGKVFLSKILTFIKNNTFLGCMKIYLISYIVCLIGTKIFKKTKFRHLFS
jgi:fucose 4-O-acetylase-like acetyltransferase